MRAEAFDNPRRSISLAIDNIITQIGNKDKALTPGSSDREYRGVYKAWKAGDQVLRPSAVSWLETDALSGVQGQSPAGAPSLVGYGITHKTKLQNEEESQEVCPNGGYIMGVCRHGAKRWIRLCCKRRDCPVCGVKRRKRIAYRIAQGVELLGGHAGAGWFVGTWDRDIEKKKMVQIQAHFVQWVRKHTGFHVEYAAVWELHKSGRYHLNLVFAPWVYIPQAVLSKRWERFGGGQHVWIKRVGAGIGVEAVKLNKKIGNYLAKFDQQVKTGRGVTYSKGWPKLSDPVKVERKGKIAWIYRDSLWDDSINFEDELSLGYWHEVAPGEYGFCLGEDCDCFDMPPPAFATPQLGLKPVLTKL